LHSRGNSVFVNRHGEGYPLFATASALTVHNRGPEPHTCNAQLSSGAEIVQRSVQTPPVCSFFSIHVAPSRGKGELSSCTASGYSRGGALTGLVIRPPGFRGVSVYTDAIGLTRA